MWKQFLRRATVQYGRTLLTKNSTGLSNVGRRTILLIAGAPVVREVTTINNPNDPMDAVSTVINTDSDNLREACKKSDAALKELLNTLTVCIMELSKEYQHSLMRQIEITYNCTKIGPLGEHWDSLTEYRIVAKDLQEELSRYEVLVGNIGQMVYNQALNSLYCGNPDAMELFSVEYERLATLVRNEKVEIQYWENKLLSVNRDSILST